MVGVDRHLLLFTPGFRRGAYFLVDFGPVVSELHVHREISLGPRLSLRLGYIEGVI